MKIFAIAALFAVTVNVSASAETPIRFLQFGKTYQRGPAESFIPESRQRE